MFKRVSPVGCESLRFRQRPISGHLWTSQKTPKERDFSSENRVFCVRKARIVFSDLRTFYGSVRGQNLFPSLSVEKCAHHGSDQTPVRQGGLPPGKAVRSAERRARHVAGGDSRRSQVLTPEIGVRRRGEPAGTGRLSRGRAGRSARQARRGTPGAAGRPEPKATAARQKAEVDRRHGEHLRDGRPAVVRARRSGICTGVKSTPTVLSSWRAPGAHSLARSPC